MRRAVQWLVNAWRGRRQPEQVAQAYRDTFAMPSSRIVLEDLACFCNVGNSTYVANDPTAMAVNEGQRLVFLHIAEMLALKATDFPSIVEGDDNG
jgi:hypothetical protein